MDNVSTSAHSGQQPDAGDFEVGLEDVHCMAVDRTASHAQADGGEADRTPTAREEYKARPRGITTSTAASNPALPGVYFEVFAREMAGRLDAIERQVVERCQHIEETISEGQKVSGSLGDQITDMEASMQLQIQKFGYQVEGTYWQVERLVGSLNQRPRDVIDVDTAATQLQMGQGAHHDHGLSGVEMHMQALHSRLDEIHAHNIQVSANLQQEQTKMDDSHESVSMCIPEPSKQAALLPSQQVDPAVSGSAVTKAVKGSAEKNSAAQKAQKAHMELVAAMHNAKGFAKRNHHAPRPPGREAWHRLTSNRMFHFVSVFFILMNGFLTGLESDWEVKKALDHTLYQEGLIPNAPAELNPVPFRMADIICILFWSFEVAAYAIAHGDVYLHCSNPKWKMNLLDVSCVAIAIIEFTIDILESMDNTSAQFITKKLPYIGLLRLLRVARIFRILFLVHSIPFFQGLRKLFIAVGGAMQTLAWALMLQCALMYIFTLMITTGIRKYYDDYSPGPIDFSDACVGSTTLSHTEQVKWYYGGVTITMATLFMSITGGDWTVLAEPVFQLSWVFYAIWYTYVAFVIFGLLNVFTGIFVESATHAANSDQEIIIQTQIEDEESYVNQIRLIFDRSDSDHSGNMTEKELQDLLEQEDFKVQMESLGIHATEARGLFALLDNDESGVVSIEEFLSGCMRLKGTAKAVDMVTLLFENAKLGHKVEQIRKMVAEIFEPDSQAMLDHVPDSAPSHDSRRSYAN